MRSATAASITASNSVVTRPVTFVELDFSSGFVRVNSTPTDITLNGWIFLGIGNLGSISVIPEGVDLQARGIELTLSGIPPEYISIALNESYQGRSCAVWVGFLDDDFNLIADPISMGPYRMDTMDIEIGKSAQIVVKAESRLADFNRPRIKRYTDEEQQERYPGDLGLQFIHQMAEKELMWGKFRG